MQLSLQTFQQLVQRMSAALQNSAGQLVDLSVGSVLRAILEANASIGLWLQWLIVQTLASTRAATSSGTDLDTWMADFSLTRQPAQAAHGVATFSRLLTTFPATIPVGAQIKAGLIGQSFEVVADVANPAWQPDTGVYLLPASVQTIDVPITAQTPGSQGNVMPGAITLISSALPGIDFVNNVNSIPGGSDAESDDKFRSRFRDYINSRSQATVTAVGYAIESIQQSLRYAIYENTDSTGSWRPGQFLVVVDDGTGQPPASLISVAYNAVDAVRPIGASFSVLPATAIPVIVSLTFKSGELPLTGAMTSRIVASVTQYINQLPMAATLFISRLMEAVYAGGMISQDISGVLVNGVATDFQCPPRSVLIAGPITVLQDG